MSDLPTSWPALCAVVLLLGLRHGLDADHLAAIDGLTRVGARHRRAHARYCGALGSAGHGAVVLAIAAAVGAAGAAWSPPDWFDLLGSLISIGFLAALGVVNLRAVWRAPRSVPVALVGVKGRLAARLLGRAGPSGGPAGVMGVGALFALSFDTLSQSALFAAMATQYGGLGHALTLGALFVLGMLISDGANGWWMSHLIRRTDEAAAVASRTMTLAVACVSLLVAAFGAARLASQGLSTWSDGKELAVGLAVILLIAAAYAFALRRARRLPARVASRPGA